MINGGVVEETTAVNQLNSQDVTITSTNAVQTLTFSAPLPTTFTLVFNSATSTPITFSSNTATLASNIQAALNTLATIGSGNAVVVLPSSDTSVQVVFQQALAGTQENTMTAAGTNAPTIATTTVGGSGTLNLGAQPGHRE